jgi:hypothetical protein
MDLRSATIDGCTGLGFEIEDVSKAIDKAPADERGTGMPRAVLQSSPPDEVAAVSAATLTVLEMPHRH